MQNFKMRWLVSAVLVAGTIGFFAGTSFSEDPEPSEEEMMKMMMELAKPGPGHETIDPMVGDFDVASKMWSPGADPVVSKASATTAWQLGGRYAGTDYQGDFQGMDFHGRGVMAFDNFKKQYQSIWYDSFSTNIMIMTGTGSEDGKTITMTGTWDGPMGKIPMKHVYHVEGPDTHTLTAYMSSPEGEMKHMELTFTRKKAAATPAAAPAARANSRCCPRPTTKGPGY